MGLLSYNCLYLDITFFTHSLVNLVVIFLASSFAILAILARFSIQVLYRSVSFGSGGILICVWFINSSIIGCICQFGLFFIVYMAFLRRWYVVSCFFHFLKSFLDRKPPCCVILLVNVGISGALHVSCMSSDIFCIIWSILVHAVCHWFCVSWFCVSRVVKSFSSIAFSSKNFVLKLSMFSWGMGFSILTFWFIGREVV